MRTPTIAQACLAATLVLAPATFLLGYEGGRAVQLRRALDAAAHAGAALEGALGACRAREEAGVPPAAARPVVGLTLG